MIRLYIFGTSSWSSIKVKSTVIMIGQCTSLHLLPRRLLALLVCPKRLDTVKSYYFTDVQVHPIASIFARCGGNAVLPSDSTLQP